MGVARGGEDAHGDPYLSVVVTTRNDNHGGDLLFRTQAFLNALVAQCNRFRLPTELIVVEWNPPPDRARLVEALRWPEENEYVAIRIVEVGEQLHRTHRYSDRLPLFQMIAKNVGIRRARGRFVLATNIDIVLSDGLMRFLAARRLRPDRFYRVDRYDVDGVTDADAPIEEQLQLCEGSVIRVCGRYGTRDLRTGQFYRVWLKYARLPWWLALPAQAAESAWARVRSGRAPVPVHVPARRALTAPLRLLHRGFRGLGRALAQDLSRGQRRRIRRALVRPRLWPRAVRHAIRAVASRVRRAAPAVAAHGRLVSALARARLAPLREAVTWARALPALHTNGCGDFTLMAREQWFALRGYPELQLFSMFIDSILVYSAHWKGYREVFLPQAIYHLEHSHGFKPDEEGYAEMNERLERAGGVPQIDDAQFRSYAIDMYHRRGPLEFNDECWGYAEEELPETVVYEPRLAAAGGRAA